MKPSPLDAATAEWTKAKNRLRQLQRSANNNQFHVQRVASAHKDFERACDRRAKARTEYAPVDWSA